MRSLFSVPNKKLDGIIKPSALRQSVWQFYGKNGFTIDGKIKFTVLQKLARDTSKPTTMKRARRALNLYGKWNGTPKKRRRKH